jgi:enoyl-CoA hydratase/carnithine racemase
MDTQPLVQVYRNAGVLTLLLTRPDKRNALNNALVAELAAKIVAADEDADVGAIVLAGAGAHFCAGADISELLEGTTEAFFLSDRMDEGRERVSRVRKPIIAAVRGFALGGGLEIALMCDIIIADATARFGSPEVKIGTLPGAGATQRLTRAIGTYKAAELILTGRVFEAIEAERLGLVSRLVDGDVVAAAEALAAEIAAFSRPATMLAKEAIGRALETPLSEGLRAERRLFHASLSFPDLKEGATAFAERRDPVFNRGTQ